MMEMLGHSLKLTNNKSIKDYECTKCNLAILHVVGNNNWYYCYKGDARGTLFNENPCPTCDEVIIKNIIE